MDREWTRMDEMEGVFNREKRESEAVPPIRRWMSAGSSEFGVQVWGRLYKHPSAHQDKHL